MNDRNGFLGVVACLSCGSPLAHNQRVKADRFCGGHCRWKYATLHPFQVCAGCGRPLAPGEYAGRSCASPDCRMRVGGLSRGHDRWRRETLRADARALRDREAPALGVSGPETYTLAVLPSSRARVTNLPERRRRALRDAVNRLISAAGAHVSAPPPDGPERPAEPAAPGPDEVQAVLEKACALCRGSCCENGGDHAYLTPETVRRYMEQHPDLRPRDVLAAYLGRVGNRTYDRSCVFHGPGGCGLPREMRSDTCNRYFCTGLAEFQQGLDGDAPARGFFVATDGGAIVAASFCDANGSHPFPSSPATDPRP